MCSTTSGGLNFKYKAESQVRGVVASTDGSWT